jgi:hypothetical protein
MSLTLITEDSMSNSERTRSLAAYLRGLDLCRIVPRRSDHEPPEDDLLHLIEGTLSDDQRRELEERLEHCPYSADRVAIVRAALNDAGIPLPRLWLLRDPD